MVLLHFSAVSIVLTVLRDYYIYYVYKQSLGVQVEDLTKKLKKLMDKDIFIAFKENQTNVLISFRDEMKDEVPILRIVFHWKISFKG